MGEKETQTEAELKTAPMQVNLHGMVAFYRHWYRDKLTDENSLAIHNNFMDILGYLVHEYVPEYDEAISVGNPYSEEE